MSWIKLQQSPPLPTGQAIGLALLLAAIGCGICAVALGIIEYPPAKLRAPREVILCAGLVFLIPGLMFVAQGRAPAWVSALLGALLLTVFALIPTWIALGSGPREFGGNGASLSNFLGFDTPGVGRIAFGAGALVLWIFTVIAWGAFITALPRPVRLAAGAAVLALLGWVLWGRNLEPRMGGEADDLVRLERYLAAKLAHPDYKYFAGGSGSNPFLSPPEERWIKQARARLAAGRQVPQGDTLIEIPVLSRPPTLDGRVEDAEWRGALRVPLQPEAAGAAVLLLRHGGTLYAAGMAPGDRTATGFDQLRVIFHIGLAPVLLNERVFLSGSGGMSALRTIRAGTPPLESTEWNVLSGIRGASGVHGHRQFELAIDIAEAGLPVGGAVPMMFEIEGDPVRDAEGKFKARHIEGRAGTLSAPLWLRLQ